MDFFALKQWTNIESEQHHHKIPLPRNTDSASSAPLPLFAPYSTTNLSAYSSDHSTKFSKMGSYFSLSQWQELELQALIFRHMIAGAAVPPELLHLVKKSIINSSSSSPFYLSQYYQPALVQSGYWGRAAMDPEPGRCRRTDGKKWRCSRDVVAGQKYCERHMHRGRNRSRKPVEVPTSTPYGGGAGGAAHKSNLSIITGSGCDSGSSGGGGCSNSPGFILSGTSHSTNLFHLDQRPSDSIIEAKAPFEAENDSQSNGRTLRFFDDWPKSLHDTDNSSTNLSISMPGSDFSLTLGTGNGDENSTHVSNQRDKPQVNWGMNPVAPMGGPLAEALRSSGSGSSPTSVLHRLGQALGSEGSYVSS